MFVQVIQGKVSDTDELRAAVDRWADELAPGATGWLGSTGGVTEDGRLIAVVRFESEDAARRNSDRPEQDAGGPRPRSCSPSEPTFIESTSVDLDLARQPGQRRLRPGHPGPQHRPRPGPGADGPGLRDVGRVPAGRSSAASGSGTTATAPTPRCIYFTSEAAAREGEKKEAPPELQAQMDEMGKLEVGEPTFLDLRDPWMHSPA